MKSERVNVDTISRCSGVMVLSLVVVEVRTFLDLESVVTVQLDVGTVDGVALTIESQTIVVRLSDSDILVDAVASGVSRSVVNSEIFNRDRQVSQAESVSNFSAFNADRVGVTISVGDNNLGVVDEIEQFNTVVVTEQSEIDAGEQGIVAPDADVSFIDSIKIFTVGKTSDVVVSKFNDNSLSVIVSSVLQVGAQVSGLTVDLSAGSSQRAGVNENATFSQVLGSVVNSKSFPCGIIVSVAQEFASSTRESRSVGFTVESTDLKSPDQFLGRMVVVQFESLVVGSGVSVNADSFNTRELDLFDQVFVTQLSVLSSFTGFKVDIVDHDTSISELEVAQVRSRSTGPADKLGCIFKFKVNSDFVVLQSDQGKSKTIVSAEPELEGDVKSVFREQDFRGVIEKLLTSKSGKFLNITDESSVTSFFRFGVGKFPPDIEPDTNVLVNIHTTDLNLNFFDKGVTDSSDPGNLFSAVTENFGSDSRDLDSESSLSSKITVSLNLNGVSATRAS